MAEILDPAECLLLAICSDVIEDKQTNNKTLVNLFNSVGAPSVPTFHPMITFMASVTNFQGTVPFRFEVHDPNDTVVFKVEGEAKCPDKLAVSDIVAKLIGMPLAAFGRYTVTLWMGGRYLGLRFFDVKQVNIPGVQQ